MSLLWSPGAPRLWISNNFIDTVSTIESDIKVESNVTWSSWGFLNVHSESTKKIKGNHSTFRGPGPTEQWRAEHAVYPASDRNLEIWLAETNTLCSDIMLPY